MPLGAGPVLFRQGPGQAGANQEPPSLVRFGVRIGALLRPPSGCRQAFHESGGATGGQKLQQHHLFVRRKKAEIRLESFQVFHKIPPFCRYVQPFFGKIERVFPHQVNQMWKARRPQPPRPGAGRKSRRQAAQPPGGRSPDAKRPAGRREGEPGGGADGRRAHPERAKGDARQPAEPRRAGPRPQAETPRRTRQGAARRGQGRPQAPPGAPGAGRRAARRPGGAQAERSVARPGHAGPPRKAEGTGRRPPRPGRTPPNAAAQRGHRAGEGGGMPPRGPGEHHASTQAP